MTIESATFISDLVATNPGPNDQKSEGDDHVRLVKTTLKATFPNITGAVTLTHTQLNAVGSGGSPTFVNLAATGTSALTGKVGIGGATLTDKLNIGTTADAANLVGVHGTSTSDLGMYFDSTGVAALRIGLNTTGATNGYGQPTGTLGIYGFNTVPLQFGVNNAPRMQIDGTGVVTPGATGTQSFGTSALRWSAVYGAVGNFSGTVTAAAFSGALSGAISQFTNDAGYATSAGTVAAAGTLTGSSLAANVVNSSLTSIAPNATDGTYELGFKGLPAASITTGSFVASDKGKCVYATAGVTVPNSTMATGDVVTIVNTTASPITLTAGIGTLRQAGTVNVGSRTLAAFGMASVLFQSSTIAFVSGVGLT